MVIIIVYKLESIAIINNIWLREFSNCTENDRIVEICDICDILFIEIK